MVTPTGLGAKKSAAPVGNNVGKAHDMYPSVLNSLMGAKPLDREWSWLLLMRLPFLYRLPHCLLLCDPLSCAWD